MLINKNSKKKLKLVKFLFITHVIGENWFKHALVYQIHVFCICVFNKTFSFSCVEKYGWIIYMEKAWNTFPSWHSILWNNYVIEKWLFSYKKAIKKSNPFNSIINNIKHITKDFHGKNEEVG